MRLAVVGLGLRGRQWVRAIQADGRARLVACVDVDRAVLRDAAMLLQVPQANCYEDLDAALQDAQPDAAVIATSVDDHVTPCRAALRRGVGVLVEKPFALSLRDAQALVAMAADARVPILVGQNHRYLRLAQTVRRVLRTGTLGRIGMILYHVHRGQQHLSGRVSLLPQNVIWETAVHHLDMLRYVMGQEIVDVAAHLFNLPWSRFASGASAQVLLRFAGGAQGYYGVTHDLGDGSWLRIVGERGEFYPWRRWLFIRERGRKYPRVVQRAAGQSAEALLLGQLHQALAGQAEPECSGVDNLKTMALLEACVRSAEERRSVDPRALLQPAAVF